MVSDLLSGIHKAPLKDAANINIFKIVENGKKMRNFASNYYLEYCWKQSNCLRHNLMVVQPKLNLQAPENDPKSPRAERPQLKLPCAVFQKTICVCQYQDKYFQ